MQPDQPLITHHRSALSLAVSFSSMLVCRMRLLVDVVKVEVEL